MAVTARNVSIGFGLWCEHVFFFPANVKGHQQALVYRHQNQCLCIHDYQQHCDCHKGQHGVCIRTARPIYYHLAVRYFDQMLNVAQKPPKSSQNKFKKHPAVWYTSRVCSHNHLLSEKCLSWRLEYRSCICWGMFWMAWDGAARWRSLRATRAGADKGSTHLHCQVRT